MLNTTYDIIDEVLVRAGVTSTSSGLYTDDILRSWADTAHRWAASRRKWPFTEGRVSTTWTGSEEVDFPEGWKPDSIRLLTVGGERFRKLTYNDYQRFKEEFPDSEDKVFTDYGMTMFVNVNADASGTLTCYGQYTPASIDGTDNAATTVFSNRDEDGNEAIVEEILCYAKRREKKLDESAAHHQRALELLDELHRRVTDEQFGYHSKDRGMFESFDVLNGNDDKDIRRDRWY